MKHLRTFNKRRNPVTIIAGVICKNAIVVGSDGQTSGTTSNTSKRLDADKIAIVTFQNEQSVMVAQSGEVVITSRLIEIMRDEAAKITIADYRTPANCAEIAVRKLKGEILQPFLPEKRTAEELQDIFNSHDASLLIAFYLDQKTPYLFTIDFSIGIACAQNKYALLGCGANVGEFLTGWFHFAEMDLSLALVAVAFIIGEVKKVDSYCGGQTHLKAINLGDRFVSGFHEPEALKIIETEIELGSQKYKSKWVALADEMGQSIAKEFLKLPPMAQKKDEPPQG